jgi:hypothetical protein
MNLTGYFKGYMAKASDMHAPPPPGQPDYIESGKDTGNEQAKIDIKYKKDTKPQARAQQKGTGYE